jgi:hypothetical protein
MFRPDCRVKDRQRACGREACQRQRRRQTQASWRDRNPTYPSAYRLKKRAVTAHAAQEGALDARGDPVECPAPLRVPRVLRSIPWDFAQAEIGVATTDLLAVLAMLLLAVVKDQIGEEKPLFIGTYAPVGNLERKDE